MKAHQEHTHHVTPVKYYILTFIALTILMLLTVGVVYFPFESSYINNAINLTIAVIKATLVICVFMGVVWSTHLTKMFAIAGFVWLSLMGITFGDYLTRQWEPSPGWYLRDSKDTSWKTVSQSGLEENFRSKAASEYSNDVKVQSSGTRR